MTLKKMLLLASAVMALVAFAAPAAASADQWHTDPGNVLVGGAAEPDHVTLTGNLKATQGGISLGSCATTLTAELWNESGVATGEAVSFTFATGPGCVVKAGETTICNIENIEAGVGHINTNGTAIDIENVFFLQHFSEGCAIGEEGGAFGTLTGTWEVGGHCIVFSNSGDLQNERGPVTMDGVLCNAALTLN
jgi:hypothetical protein